jgi:hypothetical protein
LPSLSDILKSKLHNLPFIALYGIFQDFRVTFEKAGIPNEYALSTVIALYLDDFYVDRYRYVYLKKPSKSTSLDSYIEQWIEEQDGEVKRSELEKSIIEQVGIRTSLVQLALQRLNNIIVTRQGYLIHVDNTGLSSENLKPLYRWVQSALERHEHIGINRLYKEQQVTCFKLNIKSKKMLYDVMRFFFSGDFDFTRYPNICKHNQSKFNTLGEAVLDYIKKQNAVISVGDYIKYFEAKGYSPIQLQARLYYLPMILPYYCGCIVHEDTIGWNKTKEDQLHHVLSQAYSSRIELGYLMGDLEDVYNRYEDQLPKLSNNINWTGDLLSILATRLEDVKLIGNAKRAYCITSYKEAFKDISDLIVVVVRDHFCGGCSRDQMNQWLQENGVIRKQLTGRMFTTPTGLYITEYEYVWKGGPNA